MPESIAADELRTLIERVERLTEEKQAIAEDIRDVYAEAKSRGYVTPIMKEIVKLRAMEPHKRQERDALLGLYRDAVGLPFGETPLGGAAEEQDLEALAEKIIENGGRVVDGHLVMPLGEASH